MFTQLIIIVITLICTYSLGLVFQKYFFDGIRLNPGYTGILGFIGWSAIGGVIFLIFDHELTSKIVLFLLAVTIPMAAYVLVRHKVNTNLKKKAKYRIATFIIFALIVANVTNTADSNIFDTGAYHVVLVKWLKEYGVVAGIANLDMSYGAFSPIFILGALFENVTNTEISWKVLNAAIYLCHISVAITLFNKRENWREWGILFGYIPVIFFSRGYVASLSPDLWVNLAIPFSLLLFSRSLNSGHLKLLLLIVFTTFTVWVKLSSLPLILLPIFAFISNNNQIYNKKIILRTGLWFVVLGSLFSIYNLLISGHLLFPVSFTGFSFDWTVPADRVERIRTHIYLWGIDPSYDLNINYDGFWWLKDWIKRNFSVHLYRNELLVFPFLVVGLIIKIFILVTNKSSSKAEKNYYVYSTVLFFMSLIFWFYGSPNMRFFSPWIWAFAGIVLLMLFELFANYIPDSIRRWKTFKYSTLLVLIYLISRIAIESGIRSKLIQDGMWFETYNRTSVSYKIHKLKNGQKIHVPTESKQPWYIPLPSSRQWPVYATGSINEGFKPLEGQDYNKNFQN